jgi:hypothetical protein
MEEKGVRIRRLADATVLRARASSDDAAYVVRNTRHPGLWSVYRGPNFDSMAEALSGGYESYDAAVEAATAWIVRGERIAPTEGWVHPSLSARWRVADTEGGTYGPQPYGPGMLLTLIDVRTGEAAGCVVSIDEYLTLRNSVVAGNFPSLAIPARRLLNASELDQFRQHLP